MLNNIHWSSYAGPTADLSCCAGHLQLAVSVTSIGSQAFSSCSSLAQVTIPGSVTSIGDYAFAGCSGLAQVTIPDSVTSIGSGAFEGCSSLAQVTISGSVTSIGYRAFYGCSSLAQVTIPGSVTSIGYEAFTGCSSLAQVTIPDSVTSIGSSAFEGCSNLAQVTIPASVTSIGGDAFPDECVVTYACPVGARASVDALCHCEDGFMYTGVLGDDYATYAVCNKCPHPQRCVAGACALNSAGIGCSECAAGHFEAGGRCLACSGDGMGAMMMLTAVGALLFLLVLWRVTRVRTHGDEDDVEVGGDAEEDSARATLEDIAEQKDTAKSAGTEIAKTGIVSSLSNSAIYASLAMTHMQFSFMALQLPFGFPDALIKLSRMLGGLFTFDFGVLASPECNVQDEPIETVLLYKFGFTQGAFFLLLGTIFLAKLHCGEHNNLHASNAGTALYTLSLSMLARSCVR